MDTAATQPTKRESLRWLAHKRLDETLDLAEQSRWYGQFGVEVTYEAGEPRIVQRIIKPTDK